MSSPGNDDLSNKLLALRKHRTSVEPDDSMELSELERSKLN